MRKFLCDFRWRAVFVIVFSFVMVSTLAYADSKQFTTDFNLGECTFSSVGANTYFSLKPGTEIFLQAEEGKELVQVQITVLKQTKFIDLVEEGLRMVKTRVILEEEWVDGELVEESWNWFARCNQTNDIYYFGEYVNIYENGEISHEGAWEAGEDGALPGLIMPGTFLLGSRYYQEIAPDVAMDRGENVEMGLTVDTPAATFNDCVKVLETTPLEPNAKDIKIYAPGVGLIVDETLQRVSSFTPVP